MTRIPRTRERSGKKLYQSKTIITMCIAVLYAIFSQLAAANDALGNFSLGEVNWPTLVTAVLAIVFRFFNNEKLKL